MFPEQVLLPIIVVGDWAGMRLKVQNVRRSAIVALLGNVDSPDFYLAIAMPSAATHRIGVVEMTRDKGDVL